MQLNHNITFTLGDTSSYGHCMTSTYHFVCNYSTEEIEKAYKEATKELGFDFIHNVCVEYEDNLLSLEYAEILVEKGVLHKEWIEDSENEYMYIDGEEEYIDIVFGIIKLKLPLLTYDYRDLNEESLLILNDAAYGLFH